MQTQQELAQTKETVKDLEEKLETIKARYTYRGGPKEAPHFRISRHFLDRPKPAIHHLDGFVKGKLIQVESKVMRFFWANLYSNLCTSILSLITYHLYLCVSVQVKRAKDQDKLKDFEKVKLQHEQLLEFKTRIMESQAQLQKELQKAKHEAREAVEAR